MTPPLAPILAFLCSALAGQAHVERTPGGPGLGTGPGGLVAQCAWVGPGLRPLARTHGNGTALSFLAPAGSGGPGAEPGGAATGYDLVQRVTRLQHLAPGGVPGGAGAAAFVDREYGHDRANNRTLERRLDDNGLEDRYVHDSTYRLVEAAFDQAGAPGAARRELEGARYRYDGAGNRVEVVRALAPAPGGGGGDGEPAPALRADERVVLGPRARVEGDVVAGRAPGAGSGGPGAPGSGPSQVVLEPDARVVGSVAAEEVRLQPRARVDGDVRALQVLLQPQASVGGAVLPYAPPASPLPGVPAIAPSAQDVTIRPNQAALLLPGAYRRVVVQARGRLVLQAGTYALERLEVGPQARVEVLGPVVVRTTTRLDLGPRSAVLLAPGLQAPDARFETTDPSPQLGPDATVQAVVVAPAGEVRLQPSTELVGQVYARRVTLQPQVVVRGQGLGGGGPGDPGDPGPGEPREERVAYATNALNQYTQVGGVARLHDRNGNLVDDGQRRLTWDHRNRLVAVHDRATGRPIASYAYDAFNRRVTKTTYSAVSPGAVERTTRSLWDGWDLIEEQDTAGQTTATWVCAVGIDEHLAWTRTAAHPLGAGAFYLHQDARGSVVAVTDPTGAVVERTRYDDVGRPDHESALGQEHGFQGRQRDPETGWVYFRNRFYDPETGRFLSRDPVWDAGNVGNLYAFVGNGPTTRRDPLGLMDMALLQAARELAQFPHDPALVQRLAGRLARGAPTEIAVEMWTRAGRLDLAAQAAPTGPEAVEQALARIRSISAQLGSRGSQFGPAHRPALEAERRALVNAVREAARANSAAARLLDWLRENGRLPKGLRGPGAIGLLFLAASGASKAADYEEATRRWKDDPCADVDAETRRFVANLVADDLEGFAAFSDPASALTLPIMAEMLRNEGASGQGLGDYVSRKQAEATQAFRSAKDTFDFLLDLVGVGHEGR